MNRPLPGLSGCQDFFGRNIINFYQSSNSYRLDASDVLED